MEFSNFNKLFLAVETATNHVETDPDKLEEGLMNGLDITLILNKLDILNKEGKIETLFNEILDESKDKIIDKKKRDKFLEKLKQAKEGDYNSNDAYFVKKRLKFLDVLSKAYFFSNTKKCARLRDYTKTLGKLKDIKEFKKNKHSSLIDDNTEIIEIVSNLTATDLASFKTKYETIQHEIQELMNTENGQLDEHVFHTMRKNVRYCVYVMETLMKKLDLPEYGVKVSILKSISKGLGDIREEKYKNVTGEERKNIPWKQEFQDLLKETNGLSALTKELAFTPIPSDN